MQPQFVIYADSIPRNAPTGVQFIQYEEEHKSLFTYLKAEISAATTIAFASFDSPQETEFETDFSEHYALEIAHSCPNVSLYELENETLLDLLGAEDAFESHFEHPEFRTVKLSSKRDVKAIFKLARMLSENFEGDRAIASDSCSVCRFLTPSGATCRSLHVVSGGVLEAFGDGGADSAIFRYLSPILRMSKNIFVVQAVGAQEIQQALQLCRFELRSREITLMLQPGELQLTPIDEVLEHYDDALELSKIEENSLSQEREYLETSQLALQQSVQHIIESGIDDLDVSEPAVQLDDQPPPLPPPAQQSSEEILRQVNFKEPAEMYREFSDNAKIQNEQAAQDVDPRDFDDLQREALENPAESLLPLREAQRKYEESLAQLKKAERVRLDLEAKLRLVEATASEYLLKSDLERINLEKRTQKAKLLVEGTADQAEEVIREEEAELEALESEYIQAIFKTFEILRQSTSRVVQSKKYALITNLLTNCKEAVDQRIQREKAEFEQLRRERQFIVAQHFLQQQNQELKDKTSRLEGLQTERKALEKQLQELEQIDKQVGLQLQQEKAKFARQHAVLEDLQNSLLQAQSLKQLLGKFNVETAVQEREFVEQAQDVLSVLNEAAEVKLLTPDEARLRSDLQSVVANQVGECAEGYEASFAGLTEGVCAIEKEIEAKLLKMLQ